MIAIRRQWVRPEWERRFPDDWDRRLREVSPIVDRTSYLYPRWRAQFETWELYELVPAALLSHDRRRHLEARPWSELPPSVQAGRRTFVTDYQHWMFRTRRVDARRFWVLQGFQGGTPAVFSDREKALLGAVGESVDARPLGSFPAAPFDERAVRAILMRDRLWRVGGSLDALEKLQTADGQRREDAETAKAWNAAFLAWWTAECRPQTDFLKWFLRKSDAPEAPKTPDHLSRAAETWEDRFLEGGMATLPITGGMTTTQQPLTPSLMAHATG